MTTSRRYIPVTECAKLVRAALKKEFPATKFSVKSKSYSGGASVDVRWTDGPTSHQVDQILGRYEGASFDGMIDLKSYQDSVLDGEKVHFGADYVHSQRDYSITFIMRVATVTCAYFDLPIPALNRYNWFDRAPETSKPILGDWNIVDLFNQMLAVTNADDETLAGSWGRAPQWIEAVWLAAKNTSELRQPNFAKYNRPEHDDNRTPFSNPAVTLTYQEIVAASEPNDDLDNQVWALQHPEDEAETVDDTPCVKVSAETLQPIAQRDSLRERIADINVDALSPLEALTLMYELKRLAVQS